MDDIFFFTRQVFGNFRSLINDDSLWSITWLASSVFLGFSFYVVKGRSAKKYFLDPTFRSELFTDLKWIFIGIMFMTVLTAILSLSVGRGFLLDQKDVRFFLEPLIQKKLNSFRIELDPFWGELFAVFVFFLAWDFSFFMAHWVLHRFSFFWQFHKIHHLATRLSPLTRLRVHPVEIIVNGFFAAVIVGSTKAIVFNVFYIEHPIHYLTVDVFYFAYLLTAHLRHSAIPLGFGRPLSYVFSSPVMHQIHHSVNPAHENKNFGICLSIWDSLFKTLYIPLQGEGADLKFGVRDPQEVTNSEPPEAKMV